MKAKIAHKTCLIKQNFTLGLLVVLLFTLMAFSITAIADEADTPTGGNTTTSGMQINKTATANDDGTYQITLEAYATGEKVITGGTITPVDMIIVVDQSSSMENEMSTESYTAYSGNDAKNSNLYDNRFNDGKKNLYYKVNNGSYVSVSVVQTSPDPEYIGHDKSEGHSFFYSNQNNLYAKVNDECQKVEITQTGTSVIGIANKYEYRLNGTTIATASREALSSEWSLTDISNTDDGKLYVYTIDESKIKYTYSYTLNDVTTPIGTSIGADTQFTNPKLYYKTTGSSITRIKATKDAVTSLANEVKKAAEANKVDHRIAIVGFGSDKRSYCTGSELFIGSTGYNYDGGENNAASDYYNKALQDMSTTAGQKNITESINALAAEGGTAINLGVEMANGILEAYKNNTDRQKVVVILTDGMPGIMKSDNKATRDGYANRAIGGSDNGGTTGGTYKAKNTYGATVYTIGIFDGADASTPNSLEDNSTSWQTNNNKDNSAKINTFLHLLSSNYPEAESMSEAGTLNPIVANGSGSYYLSAGKSTDLNDIFTQIGENVEVGGSSTTLDSSTVIKDIIAPQFQLPEDATAADITLETYAYTGANTWTKNDTAKGATATINATTGNVGVTGFDFADNWCGTETTNGSTTYRGNKLVIKFNVQTKPGFLGGNDVYTNTSASVYENAAAENPFMTFNRPQVNVPIKDVTVGAADKNVYLLGSLTAEQIRSGATAKCGDVELELNETNYGLESWQTDYVDITVTYTDNDGNTIANLSDLKDDTTYTVSVTVSPKTTTPESDKGTVATAKSGNKEGKINVFKPELTFKDSEVYYGDNAPTSYNGNKTGEVWKHGETIRTNTGVTMIGEAPALTLAYTPEEGTVDSNGKIAVKTDIPVDVTVKIGEGDNALNITDNTAFVHTKCNDDETDPTNGKFWLHVKTCSLTIAKEASANTTIGSDEYFVFNVYKDNGNEPCTQLTITGTGSVTISELPVGTYTVKEDTDWSWRYSPKYSGNPATLSSTNTSNTITCTNTLTKKQWLNGFSAVVKNVFGIKKVQ